jgi:hypothetical protein
MLRRGVEPGCPSRLQCAVHFYGVVDSRDEGVVEFFLIPQDAQEFITQVFEDEPELAALLRIEAVEFETIAN